MNIAFIYRFPLSFEVRLYLIVHGRLCTQIGEGWIQPSRHFPFRHFPRPLQPPLEPPRHPSRHRQHNQTFEATPGTRCRSPHESANVPRIYMAGYRPTLPCHAAHRPHPVALVELASRGVLLPDAKVGLTSQWPHYLGAEPLEGGSSPTTLSFNTSIELIKSSLEYLIQATPYRLAPTLTEVFGWW
jgi:hypothetical protein